ncbi:MAG: response regulator transcription factor [Bdellovibrionota bacterium]
MKKILVVEDSIDSLQLVVRRLKPGYQLVHAPTLKIAESLLAAELFDLVLLDLSLPDGDGHHLCSSMRTNERYDHVPIIVLSARFSILDKIMAFSVGADDYVTKPCDPEELHARIAANLRARKSKESKAVAIQIGELEIDQVSHRVTIKHEGRSESLSLTALELKILMYLSKQKKRIVSRSEILDSVWGQNVHVFARNVDTHISKLRKKLGRLGPYIQSTHGRGYSLAPPDPKPSSGLPFAGSNLGSRELRTAVD